MGDEGLSSREAPKGPQEARPRPTSLTQSGGGERYAEPDQPGRQRRAGTRAGGADGPPEKADPKLGLH